MPPSMIGNTSFCLRQGLLSRYYEGFNVTKGVKPRLPMNSIFAYLYLVVAALLVPFGDAFAWIGEGSSQIVPCSHTVNSHTVNSVAVALVLDARNLSG